MAEYWKITCKDCGINFEYSDYILQMDKKRGQSRPERCPDCRVTHSSEIKSVGNSHFELVSIAGGPSILGVPFIGMLDHKGRTIEKYDLPDNSVKMDLGLEDGKEDTIKKIYEKIDNHQVIIIVAATGTGKSTYLPFRLAFPLLYEKNNDPNKYLKYGPIVVTQPRIIATESIPQAIAKNLVISKVGEGFEIGYKHGKNRRKINLQEDGDEINESKIKKQIYKDNKSDENYSFRNRLIFVTDGSLLNWISEGRIGRFSIIIIDEAHERSKNIDVILSLIQKELPKYPHLKLIILSATIDSRSFEDYFKKMLNHEKIIVMDFTADKYAVKKFKYEEVGDWKWSDLTNEEIEYNQNDKDERDERKELEKFGKFAPTQIAEKVVELLRDKQSEGGILAFLPGVKEIKECIYRVKELYKIDEGIKLFELHGSLSEEERDKAAEPFKEEDKIIINGEKIFHRRVVIATNIAETSVTFDDIVHVIDSGLIKQSYWDSNACVQNMRTQFHSKDGCKQRWGRTGRKCNGFVYRLYSKDWFIRFFPSHTSPEIERCCLDDVFLSAIESGVTDVTGLSWLTQPNSTEFNRVNNLLSKRKLVDSDGDLTENGREILRLRKSKGAILDQFDNSSSAFALDIASLMVKADKFGCLVETATLASAIPHLGASMYIPEDKIEKNYKGFFIWNNKWDLLSKDYVCEIQKSLQTGCNDDLDFIFKLSIIIDFYYSKEVKFINDFVKKYFVCEPNIFKYLKGRESLLQTFIKGKKDGSIRSLEYKLIQKLRVLIPLALPDKLGIIINHNGQLVFENEKGVKYLLSQNLSGNWKEGDKAVGLIYKQSSFIIEKNPDTLLKDTPTVSYVDFLIRVHDSEFFQEDEINDYQILQYLKNKLNESEDIRLRNLFVPMFALPRAEIQKNAIINGEVKIKDIASKPFQIKYDEVGLNQDDIDEIESEDSIQKEMDGLTLKTKINKKIKKLFEQIKSIQVSYKTESNSEKCFFEKWIVNETSTVAHLNDVSYYSKKILKEIMDKDYIGVTLHHGINDCLLRNIVGYMCIYRNQYFPVPIENITIDPFVPFQESLSGKSLCFYNFKIKSLPFYYGLTILPKIEEDFKRLVASQVVSIKLYAIKNMKIGSLAFFRAVSGNDIALYFSVWYNNEDYKFDEFYQVIISFKIDRETIIEKELVCFNIEESTKVLQFHNFVYENGEVKCKDLRPISQFIDVFDKLFAINNNFNIYRLFRRLYTNTYNMELQMEAIFDQVIKEIDGFIGRIGSIKNSEREAFKSEINDYQKMLRSVKNQLLPSFETLNKITSTLWRLDTKIAEINKFKSKKRVAKDKNEQLDKERAHLTDSITQLKSYVINQFSIRLNYGVIIVGSNETFETIQSAIDSARDGDLILVKNGVYEESIIINKNITLQNMSNNREDVIVNTNSEYTILVKSERVCLSRITIQQKGVAAQNDHMHAAICNTSKSLFLDNCKIESLSHIGIKNHGTVYIYQSHIIADENKGAGIYSDQESVVNMYKSVVNCCACGIYSENCDKILVFESTISTDIGIWFEGTFYTSYEADNNLLTCREPLRINAPVRRNKYAN